MVPELLGMLDLPGHKSVWVAMESLAAGFGAEVDHLAFVLR